MEYKFKAGTRLKQKDPNKVHDELEECKTENGYIDIEKMIDRAKIGDAVLHREYEWDNNIAAHEYRKGQSRTIIRSLVTVAENTNIEHRVYHAVTETREEQRLGQKVYRSLEDILADPEQRSGLLIQAMNDAHTFRRKYAALQEFAQIHEAIDQAILSTSVA